MSSARRLSGFGATPSRQVLKMSAYSTLIVAPVGEAPVVGHLLVVEDARFVLLLRPGGGNPRRRCQTGPTPRAPPRRAAFRGSGSACAGARFVIDQLGHGGVQLGQAAAEEEIGISSIVRLLYQHTLCANASPNPVGWCEAGVVGRERDRALGNVASILLDHAHSASRPTGAHLPESSQLSGRWFFAV
jgi:hypothetical protein